jgi:hypothetical protein
MVDGPITNAFTATANSPREIRGLRTRVLLTLAMAGIIAGTTLVSVLAIRQSRRTSMIPSPSSQSFRRSDRQRSIARMHC